jgi:hypothetical protein
VEERSSRANVVEGDHASLSVPWLRVFCKRNAMTS